MKKMDIPWDRTIVSRAENGRRRMTYQETTAVRQLLGDGLFDGLPHQTEERMFVSSLAGEEAPGQTNATEPDEIDVICDAIAEAVQVILRRHLQ